MSKLAIVGASGHGKVVADLAELLGYEVVFFDDAQPKKKTISGWRIEGDTADLVSKCDTYPEVIIAIGDNKIRAQKLELLSSKDFLFPALVHPKAVVSKYTSIGCGSVVMAGVVVNAGAVIQRGCIINSGSVIEHDCLIKRFSHISPNATLSGSVSVGSFTWIGAGTSIKQLVSIGDNVVIGAGSVVVNDISSDCIAYGVPAQMKK